jgi:hypothetical protein
MPDLTVFIPAHLKQSSNPMDTNFGLVRRIMDRVSTSATRKPETERRNAITSRQLLTLNLVLQAFDGTASYFIIAGGAPELNPLVRAAIDAWGLGCGMLSCKIVCSIFLLLVHSLGRYQPTITSRGLIFSAITYASIAIHLATQF